MKMKKKFRVVSYMRVDPDEPESLTWEEAVEEKEHCEFLFPEDIFVIEEVEE
jgi:hypothetical protein